MDTNSLFISPQIFNGLNVKGFFTSKSVNGDLEIISTFTGIPVSKIYHPIQRHTDKVIVLNEYMGREIGDAVLTLRTDVLIGIDVADCVPILLYDRRLNAVGAVHAGWRGTANMIVKKAIIKMADEFGSSPSDIFIALGPAIKSCCYEVGNEVIEAIQRHTDSSNWYEYKDGKYLLDLQLANIHQALSVNVPLINIWLSEYCTFCHPDKFFSYRYTKGKTGRQSGYIKALAPIRKIRDTSNI